ncbi:MAG: 50S ribosomal protein L24 [Parcubacteria group bacterium]|jgi:large subunit ribosomal protein L24|nr:50S ribosomal protein L24 [Parcubacteria group bacterium]|tara:strand:- start:27385 stop:27690 length:306 start_codon:yes stop_codon:yes gene_type:complete
MKIKKGDQVLVISGKDKGKKAKVLEAFPVEEKIVVQGVNIVRKHRRPKNEKEKGQIVEIPKAISVSNVKLVCPKCGKPARVGYQLTEKTKYRICKKCQQEV